MKALTGTGALIRFNLRRDRIRIPAWVLGVGIVQATAPGTYVGLYPTEVERAKQAAVVSANPAMKAMTGPAHGIDNYTYGAMMTNEYLGFMVIFAALMSVFMVIRHTRAEEETGRAELVRASVVGRHAHMTAALVTAAIANVLLGLLIAVGMGASGVESVDWAGSFAFGAAFVAVGMFFAGVAALTAQVTENSRSAAGMAGALIGLAYLLRAIGDVSDNALSWLSPIGWAQAAAPYVDNNWWPLLLAFGAAAALCVAGYQLSSRRDIGAGLRAERPGPSAASALLGTPGGFAWRLQRAGLMWWAIAMLVVGMAYGSAIDVIEDYSDNEIIQEIIKNIGGASLVDSWLTMIIALLSIVCTIFSIIAVLRPRREETSGRAEAVLATGVSRSAWVGTHLGIAMLGGVLLLAVAGGGLGIGAAAGSGDWSYLGKVLGAGLSYAPALWLTTALAIAVFGLVPRAIGLAWALLVYAIFIVYLGGLLDLPGWALDLSPYTHIPRMPVADFDATPLAILTAIAAALVAAGLIGFRRRDVEAS